MWKLCNRPFCLLSNMCVIWTEICTWLKLLLYQHKLFFLKQYLWARPAFNRAFSGSIFYHSVYIISKISTIVYIALLCLYDWVRMKMSHGPGEDRRADTKIVFSFLFKFCTVILMKFVTAEVSELGKSFKLRFIDLLLFVFDKLCWRPICVAGATVGCNL